MADYNSSDVSTSIIFESTYGVTPTTGATRYEVPTSVDQPLLVAESTTIKSNTKKPNNAAGGSRRGVTNVTGALNTRAFSGALHYALMESLFRSSFTGTTTKTLKAAKDDKSFSVIHQLALNDFEVFSGALVKGLTIDVKANDEVNYNWDLVGTGFLPTDTDNPLSVTPTAYDGVGEFTGLDLANVTIAGQSVDVLEMSVSIAADRPMRPVCGTNVQRAPGYNGARDATVSMKVYRGSNAYHTLLTGGPQAFSFDLGPTGSGTRYSCPAVIFDIPKNELSNGSVFFNVTGTINYDATAQADIVVTQL